MSKWTDHNFAVKFHKNAGEYRNSMWLFMSSKSVLCCCMCLHEPNLTKLVQLVLCYNKAQYNMIFHTALHLKCRACTRLSGYIQAFRVHIFCLHMSQIEPHQLNFANLIHLGPIMTRFNITWYFLQHCNHKDRTCTRLWTHKIHLISHPYEPAIRWCSCVYK